MAITFIGVRALSVIGMIAAPLFVVVAIVRSCIASEGGRRRRLGATREPARALRLQPGAALTLVIATFADSGTMTADFTRWSRNGREGSLAAFTAFPVANFVAFLVGADRRATGGSRTRRPTAATSCRSSPMTTARC